eukprot:scaffold10220_cov148-Cylindrotheca_fusiformis.AAC.2
MATRKFGSARIDCPVCSKRVYPLESVQYEGKTYHKGCMQCTHCKGKLSIKAVAVIDGQLYCKPHFVELFKSGGGKYDGFSSPNPSNKAPVAPGTGEKPYVSADEAEVDPADEPEKDEEEKVEEEAPLRTPVSKINRPPPSSTPQNEFSSFKLKSTSTPNPSGGDIRTPETKNDSPPPSSSQNEFNSIKLKSSSSTPGGSGVGGDIFRDLKMRNLDSLKKTVESGGIDTIFQAGSDGVTPIEYAFKVNSQECGRYMIKYLQEHISSELVK